MSLEGALTAGAELKGKLSKLNAVFFDAYAVAVRNGFKGTEEEWLNTIKGEKGDKGEPGKDAIIEQSYNPQSEKAQSGVAVASALVNYLPLNIELQLELDGGDAGGALDVEYIVDSEMSDISPNAVGNRVIKQYIDSKTENLKPIQYHQMFGTSYGYKTNEKYYRRWYYVDNINGNDNNNGDAWTRAFQTLKKALDTANAEGNHDVKIALAGSEIVYEYPYVTCANSALHISGYIRNADGTFTPYKTKCKHLESPPVTLKFTDNTRSNAFYCGHINFVGIKFVKDPIDEAYKDDFNPIFYSDGGMVLFNCCQLDAPYQQNGGTLWISDCYISQLVCKHATVKFLSGENTFTGADVVYETYPNKIYIAGGMCTVVGNLTFYDGNNENPNYSSLIRLIDTIFLWEGNTEIAIGSGRAWSTDLSATYSILRIADTHWNSLRKSIGGSLRIAGNTSIVDGVVKQMASDGSVL